MRGAGNELMGVCADTLEGSLRAQCCGAATTSPACTRPSGHGSLSRPCPSELTICTMWCDALMSMEPTKTWMGSFWQKSRAMACTSRGHVADQHSVWRSGRICDTILRICSKRGGKKGSVRAWAGEKEAGASVGAERYPAAVRGGCHRLADNTAVGGHAPLPKPPLTPKPPPPRLPPPRRGCDRCCRLATACHRVCCHRRRQHRSLCRNIAETGAYPPSPSPPHVHLARKAYRAFPRRSVVQRGTARRGTARRGAAQSGAPLTPHFSKLNCRLAWSEGQAAVKEAERGRRGAAAALQPSPASADEAETGRAGPRPVLAGQGALAGPGSGRGSAQRRGEAGDAQRRPAARPQCRAERAAATRTRAHVRAQPYPRARPLGCASADALARGRSRR